MPVSGETSVDKRYLIVTADDFGIGPATSQGILDLAVSGPVCATVLLVNSPYAEAGVNAWRQAGRPLELGWHPCLTLDAPVLPPSQVPSLVGKNGRFRALGAFLARLLLGRIRATEIEAELTAQYHRFRDLVGKPPTLVNTHHHVQVFPPIGRILRRVLQSVRPRPYVRCVREPWRLLRAVPGARVKRLVLSGLGRGQARHLQRDEFPGNDWLAGITNPANVWDPDFLVRWLQNTPGTVVELTCHPGYLDATLVGRDCTLEDGQLERRVREFHLLRHASFRTACQQAAFTLIAPSELHRLAAGHIQQAA